MAEPWQRTDFSKKGGGNQRADERTEKALERLKRADRRRAAGWTPDDGSHVLEPGTRRRIGKVDNATGKVVPSGWRGKIDVNKKKPGEPIPKGEIQITKSGKTVEVNPTPRRMPPPLPRSDQMAREAREAAQGTGKYDWLAPDEKAAKQAKTLTEKGAKALGKGLLIGVATELVGEVVEPIPGSLITSVPAVALGVLGSILRRGEQENQLPMKKKIPKQTPKNLSPKKGRRNGPCPSMTRKGKTLYARDGSRCGRRAATVRGPTRGYD